MNFNTEKKYVYLIKATLSDGTLQYKIGVSKHPAKRLLENKTSNPNQLELVKTFFSSYPFLVETTLKNRFKLQQIEGEWFDLTEEMVDDFERTCELIEKNYEAIRSSSLYD